MLMMNQSFQSYFFKFLSFINHGWNGLLGSFIFSCHSKTKVNAKTTRHEQLVIHTVLARNAPIIKYLSSLSLKMQSLNSKQKYVYANSHFVYIS